MSFRDPLFFFFFLRCWLSPIFLWLRTSLHGPSQEVIVVNVPAKLGVLKQCSAKLIFLEVPFLTKV